MQPCRQKSGSMTTGRGLSLRLSRASRTSSTPLTDTTSEASRSVFNCAVWMLPPMTGKKRASPSGSSSKSLSSHALSEIPSRSSTSASSRKVSTQSTTPASSGRSASAFLATQGPMKTTRACGPSRALMWRAWATIGETMGVRTSSSAGAYFSTYVTTAGQAVHTCGRSGCRRTRSAVWAAT